MFLLCEFTSEKTTILLSFFYSKGPEFYYKFYRSGEDPTQVGPTREDLVESRTVSLTLTLTRGQEKSRGTLAQAQLLLRGLGLRFLGNNSTKSKMHFFFDLHGGP